MAPCDNLTVVTWNDPVAELTGLARFATALVHRGATTPPRIGFAAPNRTWALQLQRACAEAGLPAVLTSEPLDRGVRRASIMDFRHAWTDFAYLFVVGCVEGLIPTAQALDDETALANQRAAFDVLASAPGSVVLSNFTVIGADLATQICVPFRRTKVIDGVSFARVAPARFLNELGSARPSTIGGQQFLRNAGLN